MTEMGPRAGAEKARGDAPCGGCRPRKPICLKGSRRPNDTNDRLQHSLAGLCPDAASGWCPASAGLRGVHPARDPGEPLSAAASLPARRHVGMADRRLPGSRVDPIVATAGAVGQPPHLVAIAHRDRHRAAPPTSSNNAATPFGQASHIYGDSPAAATLRNSRVRYRGAGAAGRDSSRIPWQNRPIPAHERGPGGPGTRRGHRAGPRRLARRSGADRGRGCRRTRR
jgi:hypothetical protein